ncbi:MAG: hypothetical protein M3Z13_07330 [Candidatus Dormibacteraeota bacterium]|nr:hypothetical protein [Candidatus Dormibacteraeota bacterium]
MAGKESADDAEQEHGPSFTLPVTGIRVTLPPPAHLAWYVGVGIMAALEVVEWPVALVIAASHAIAQRTHDKTVANLAEGAESGA